MTTKSITVKCAKCDRNLYNLSQTIGAAEVRTESFGFNLEPSPPDAAEMTLICPDCGGRTTVDRSRAPFVGRP